MALLITGSTGRSVALGQRITPADVTGWLKADDSARGVGRKAGAGDSGRKPGAGGGPGRGSGSRGSPSLAELVAAGVLVPGRGRITVTYKGQTVTAALLPDGVIEYSGQRYNSATAFSIHYKRTITPSKQGDDGWKSVCYDGKPLEHYRRVYTQGLARAAPPAAGDAGGGF